MLYYYIEIEFEFFLRFIHRDRCSLSRSAFRWNGNAKAEKNDNGPLVEKAKKEKRTTGMFPICW